MAELKIEKCVKAFKDIKALDGFTLEFENGVYGLLGPNGAGKTTLLRCICGLYKPDSGKITVPKTVGYLPQKFGMMKQLSVYNAMDYMAILKGIDKAKRKAEIERCLEMVNLTDRMQSLVRTLSGGMLRRLGVAQAILGSPEVLLFDEPTAGLDPEERLRFKTVIRQISKDNVVLISTHIVSDVEAICDKIILMDRGKALYSGTGSEIAALAAEKVYMLSEEQVAALQGSYYIEEQREESGEVRMRVLSAEPQCGEKCKPTIEDGYLCAIKQIGFSGN